ncbi:hypothetical protein KC343_g7722 [Hortaea werneckii]|uniref:Xylanolytic transcriptional activator regulatory domain-containing protein n=1 Tax=Hortaea werneckii TaxID=91943 RepID=A0A3M7GXU8_HORWE|nr:hypothetical protein KC352_g27032 [Hortaea werneckii]KAI7563394.1 hypothetical protein KC317_g7760 [Hortaea werneckii]KAI7611095.1 hypothetical protein KC346_g8461 [Hortaea werneckii]KAI7622213.1 hypothetical protein KC343_g7722 [Hortaea werneckii]KAI7668242.1 hypothetical protein KC319_g6458 [Hortaea werneckii]
MPELHGESRERNVQHEITSYDPTGDDPQARQVDFERWHGLSSISLGQQATIDESSSSLLWPDSEDLFQSLTSNDGDPWDNTMSGQPGVPFLDVAQAQALPAPLEDAAITDDGQRAVQTTNGLLTNTIMQVTSPRVLYNLTPQFLDNSLHAFFAKFNPILPVVHRPTFVYRQCSAPLLLNAIALGSLFLGTDEATATGERLWKLAHTAIATSWHDMIGQLKEHDTFSGLELLLAALLSQVYAAFSKASM